MKLILQLSSAVILLLAVLAEAGAADKTPAAGSAAPPAQRNKMTKMSVDEARKKAPFKVLEPAYLPKGVSYVETRYIEFGGRTFIVLQYEFTGQKRYFQVDEYPAGAPESAWPGTKEVQIGEYQGQAMLEHGMSAVRWTQNGTRLVVNGAIGEAEALKIARSFK